MHRVGSDEEQNAGRTTLTRTSSFSRKTCATTMETTAAAAAVASVLTGFYVRKISVGDSTSPTRGRDALRVIDKAAKLHHSTAREQTLKPSTNQKKRAGAVTTRLFQSLYHAGGVPVDTVQPLPERGGCGWRNMYTQTNLSLRIRMFMFHEAVLRQRWSSTWDSATLHVTEAPLEWLKSCVVPNDSNEGGRENKHPVP